MSGVRAYLGIFGQPSVKTCLPLPDDDGGSV